MGFDGHYSALDAGLSSALKTLARQNYPRTMGEVFNWARDLWLNQGTFSQSIQKANRYFLTEIEVVDDMPYSERRERTALLEGNGSLLASLGEVADEAVAFGNSFTSVVPAFQRRLRCPRCGASHVAPAMRGHYKYDREKGFCGTCVACGTKQTFDVIDAKKPDKDASLSVVRWPLDAIRIKHNAFSDSREYLLDLDIWPDFVAALDGSDYYHLETTPMPVIKAVSERKCLKFHKGGVYHMRSETVSEIAKDLGGWGFPRFMNSFSTVVMIMLLDKFNEVLLSDYKVPWRVFSPPSDANRPANPGMSPGVTGALSGSEFKRAVSDMIESHRRDPSRVQTMPHAFVYQVLGGEAAGLMDVNLLKFYQNQLLDDMCIPRELSSPAAGTAAMPLISLRMFEKTWRSHLQMCNGWLDWYSRKFCKMLQISNAAVRLRRPSRREDPQVQQILLNMAVNKQVSMQSALEAIGVDYLDTVADMIAEEEEIMKMRADAARRMERAGAGEAAMRAPTPAEDVLAEEAREREQAQAAQGGGAPLPPQTAPGTPSDSVAPGGSGTPSEIMAEAARLAEEIVGLPDRASRLIDLKKNNPVLHAQVTQAIQDMENDAAQTGVMQFRQMAADQGGAM